MFGRCHVSAGTVSVRRGALSGFGVFFRTEFLHNPGGFAAALAQIIQLGFSYIAVADNFNTFYQRRVQLKGAFNVLPRGGAPDNKRGVDTAAAARNNHAFECLYTPRAAVDHVAAHDNPVARCKRRNGFCEPGDLFFFKGLDDIHSHLRGILAKVTVKKLLMKRYNYAAMNRQVIKQLLLAAVLALAAGTAAAAEPLDKIVAVVNEAPISRLDITREANRLQREQEDLSFVRAEELALNYLINRELQLQRAQRLGLEVTEAMVQQRLGDLRRELNIEADETLAQVAETRFLMSPDELRQRLREDLQIQVLFYREVFAETDAYEDEIDQFLMHEAEGVAQAREYHLRHILITLAADGARLDERRALALSLRARAVAGENFARLAEEFSDGERAGTGGDLGFRAEADLPAAFVTAAQNLKPGEVSEPIKTGRGFHLLKVEAVRGGELREVIRRFLLSHIFFPLDTEAQAQAVRETLRTAEDFRDAVQKHSDDSVSIEQDGVIGWFDDVTLPPYFTAAVEQMQAGDISRPLVSPYGWHILYLNEVAEEKLNMQQLREQARLLLRERRALAQRNIWLRRLRSNAYVRILDPAFAAGEFDG